jgi:hypothetical protein
MLLSNMKIPLLFKKLKAVSSCLCIWYRGSFYLTCVTLQIYSYTVIPRVLPPPPRQNKLRVTQGLSLAFLCFLVQLYCIAFRCCTVYWYCPWRELWNKNVNVKVIWSKKKSLWYYMRK